MVIYDTREIMISSATVSNSTEQILLSPSSAFRVGPLSLPRKWIYTCEWVLLALLVAQMGLRTTPRAWHTLNTDFPNYYLTARLTREHFDTSRIYEWIWLQRQKDHRAIDQRIVTMVPITPFSTLVICPFALMPALVAKHYWLILNLGLLLATLWLLRILTHHSWRRIVLIAALSFPLRVNFMFGQYYVLLLFLLTLSCWLYIRQQRFVAGCLVGLAAGLKIFPVVYLLFFLRKRDWRAFVGAFAAFLGSFAVSVLVFGRELNHIYLTQLLPSALRGEGLDPYNLQAASLSSLIHRLFIYEPQLNPHPALNAPWLFSVVHPFLQMIVLAPALLLVVPEDHCPRQLRLEWAAVLLASLAISTSPASYLFTLLILPVALISSSLRGERKHLWIAVLLFLYVAAGLLGGKARDGWAALTAVPRLYVLILLCIFACAVLLRQRAEKRSKRGLVPWACGLLAILVLAVATNLRHQQGLYADYKWRISEPEKIFMAVHPAIESDAILFISLMHDGYHFSAARREVFTFSDPSDEDQLAITAANGARWVEQAANESTIYSTPTAGGDIQQAESPVASFDGRWLAFFREDHGRARIWVRSLGQSGKSDRLVTPAEFNVLEMSFLPDGSLVFAATSGGHSALFVASQEGSVRSLDLDNARYPSVSPDGRWLAYSQLQAGNWNLWLRNLNSGQTSRLTQAACNDTEPAWTDDSKTLVYSSDCGRGLWLSALCRRRVVP
jgi:Glycosyltransferase family 87/WD40-like Beta Propeller Repeat